MLTQWCEKETDSQKCRSGSRVAHATWRAPMLAIISVLAIGVLLAACGAGGQVRDAARVSAAADEPHGPALPGAVVAQVGSYSITGATFDRFLGTTLSELASEPLVPPRFTACVAHLKGELTAIGERPPKSSQIRDECQRRYQALLQGALERLISDEWLIGGANELDAPVGERQVKASVAQYRRESFSSEAQFRRFLAGRTLADIMLETRAKLARAAIARTVEARLRPVTRAQIVSYYAQHRFDYLLGAERDLEIARTATWASAAKVKKEIESGKSFASIVSRLPVEQPVNAGDGLVVDLQPHFYGEPNLNQAIFTARPGVLTGPIDTWFGYFVFDVTKVRFQLETPLAQVEASIRQQLARPLQERALAAFGKHWATTWTARTDCSPGYVVPKCRQFKGVPVESPEGPTTFD